MKSIKSNSTSLKKNCLIKHPKHYCIGEIEVIDFIRDWKLDYCEGNVIKYLCRYKYKDNPLQDLLKCRQYLDWVIENEKKRKVH